jgi:hypothetical protein
VADEGFFKTADYFVTYKFPQRVSKAEEQEEGPGMLQMLGLSLETMIDVSVVQLAGLLAIRRKLCCGTSESHVNNYKVTFI